MNQYRRIVSYLYKYGNGKKGENTGFVQIDTRPEGIRLHFRIKDLRMMDEERLKVYFYFHKENRLQLVFVDEFLCVRGNCEYKKVVFPDFTDSDFEKMNGVVFMNQEGLLYGSCWDEREISKDLFAERKETQEKPRTIEKKTQEETENILEDHVNEEDSDRRESEIKSEENRIDGEEEVIEITQRGEEGLLSQFPQIVLDGSEDSLQAVSITLSDLSRLPSSEWHLAENAFLKQAYESEQHLLLGRIRMPNESQVWILGVPGTYDNREKYLAGIFGFHDYIGKEDREFKTGGKGYWIRKISPVE